jgi:predicted protein tyrosine phosphatase
MLGSVAGSFPGVSSRNALVTSMPLLSQLYIKSRAEAEIALAKRNVSHLVSFRDMGALPVSGAERVRDRIELEFDATSGNAGFGVRPPQVEDIRLLVEWLRERQRPLREGIVLFQCERGVSRSPAAAVITLRILGASPQEAAREVARARPDAVPNALMLSLAEPFLGN